MTIQKSSRHSKIIGEFGEYIFCNWLSRSGFEVARIDHTGMDILAYNPKTKKRIGITIKSKTRDKDPFEAVNILYNKKDDRRKLSEACDAFKCDPWIGIYIECQNWAELYLLSLDHYDKTYRGTKQRCVDTWKMKEKGKPVYYKDPHVKHIRFDFKFWHWDKTFNV